MFCHSEASEITSYATCMRTRLLSSTETINTYNRCGLWDFNEINSLNLAVLTHISRIHIREGKLVLDGGLV